MRRAALASFAAVAAVGIALLGAVPASAADLPEDADLFTFSYGEFFATATDGALDPIGSLPDTGGKYGADYDTTTGLAYYFTDGDDCLIYTIDTTTGASSLVGAVGEATDFDECDALNVDADGVLRVADQDGVVLTLDKSTGAVISSLVTDVPAISFLAQAPDGTYYAGSYEGYLYEFDVETGAGTLVDDTVNSYESAVIDEAGTVWFLGSGVDCGMGLGSFSISDPSVVTFQGDLTTGGPEGCEPTYAILVTGGYVAPVVPVDPAAPQLAATGAVPGFIAGPLAALLLVAGLGVAFVARRRTA